MTSLIHCLLTKIMFKNKDKMTIVLIKVWKEISTFMWDSNKVLSSTTEWEI